MCMMFSQCNTCSMGVCLIRYNIKGSVATSRAMPTPFFFSRLQEALATWTDDQTNTFHAYIAQ